MPVNASLLRPSIQPVNPMQYVLPLIMEKKKNEREDALRQEQLAKADEIAKQARQERQAELKQKAFDAHVKYTQDMMKLSYEKGDPQGVRAFGEPLREIGLPVPANEAAGPQAPGQLPPVQYFAAPQKQGMSEAELTQRALGGDQMAKSVLASMAQRKQTTARAGASKIDVNVGDKSMTELGKEMSKALVSERADVVGAVRSLENLKEARSILDSGMITGTGAEYLTNVGNFLASRLGFKAAEDPVANTQAYAATMGTQVGQIIKQFGAGTGLSNEDRVYAERIVGGKITLNEQAIRKLLRINEKGFKNVIKRFNKKADQAMSRPGAESLPYDLRVDYKFDDPEKEQKKEQKKPKFKILKVE